MNYETDTIAAIASGLTDSGIGIIRISGNRVLDILEKIFVPYNNNFNVNNIKSYTAHFGHIVEAESDNIIDECIIIYMKGPHSYTGEDIVEIDSHGGIFVCNKILKLVLNSGARLAEPGEYTKRAFLNGRIDLTQAEAVMDVIKADHEDALRISVDQLKGSLKNEIVRMRNIIIHENAYIEYALDDPEHVSLDGFSEKLKIIVKDLLSDIKYMLDHSEEGRIIKYGVNTVIVGKPNAGKSSLLNSLLKEERAIVTNIPGTTRDILEERALVEGIPLNIIDTAGIRDTEDVVERIGVDRAKKSIEDADLILYVIDASINLSKEDYDIIDLIKNKKVIVLLNKQDLKQVVTVEDINNLLFAPVLCISLLENMELSEIGHVIKDMFYSGELSIKDNPVITNQRQKICLENAYKSLCQVNDSIDNCMPEDFFTIDLMEAYEQLGLIIGESMQDDLVNKIFEEFCTGK